MKKLLFPIFALIVLASSCTEPAYKLTDADAYPAILTFPKEYQGVYIKEKDSLIVMANRYRTVAVNTDIPKNGVLGSGGDDILKKHGNYYVMYSRFGNDGFYRLRFFSREKSELVVKMISEVNSIEAIKTMAISFTETEDADGMGSSQYYFTINGKILDKLMDQYLVEEFRLIKVK